MLTPSPIPLETNRNTSRVFLPTQMAESQLHTTGFVKIREVNKPFTFLTTRFMSTDCKVCVITRLESFCPRLPALIKLLISGNSLLSLTCCMIYRKVICPDKPVPMGVLIQRSLGPGISLWIQNVPLVSSGRKKERWVRCGEHIGMSLKCLLTNKALVIIAVTISSRCVVAAIF